jgi:hypothetical protein
MEFDGTSWSYVGSPGLSSISPRYVSMALGASGHIFVGYIDEANSAKPTLLKWDGTAWSTLGVVSEASAFDAGVALTPAGLPLLLFGAAQVAEVFWNF